MGLIVKCYQNNSRLNSVLHVHICLYLVIHIIYLSTDPYFQWLHCWTHFQGSFLFDNTSRGVCYTQAFQHIVLSSPDPWWPHQPVAMATTQRRLKKRPSPATSRLSQVCVCVCVETLTRHSSSRAGREMMMKSFFTSSVMKVSSELSDRS